MTRATWTDLAILAVLTLLFFFPLVLHPDQLLYSPYSDLVAWHLPVQTFFVREWRQTGELPFWCPDLSSGQPFLHDSQVRAFYPPHFVFYLIPESWVGPALSWLVVFHVFAAGACMYAYARYAGLGRAGALVAALGFMFAGKMMLHLLGAGHYYKVGLAWLPLVLLWLEQSLGRRSLLRATWAGAALALVVLGTVPQVVLYVALFVPLWTLPTALENADQRLPALARWLGLQAWMGLIALGLAAAQLSLTLEWLPLTSRSAVGVESMSLVQQMVAVFWLIGPPRTSWPTNLLWEDLGGFGFLWLAAALWGSWLGGPRARYYALVALLIVAYVVGGAALVQHLPGFRLFRLPERSLLLAAFPVAYLAGVAVQRLIETSDRSVVQRCRRQLLAVLIGGIALVVIGFWVLRGAGFPLVLHPYWLLASVLVILAYLLLASPALLREKLALAWAVLLLADLWALAWPLVVVRPEAEVMPASPLVAEIRAPGRVLDRDAGACEPSPLGRGAPLALMENVEAVRGNNPLDLFRYREYLQLLTGEDKQLALFQGPTMFPVIGDLPVRNRPLFDLLGVRWVLQPTAKEPFFPDLKLIATDPAPRSYDFIAMNASCDGGVRQLPPYALLENPAAFPRALLVPEAVALPERDRVLAALSENDFRKRVFVEGHHGPLPAAKPDATFQPVPVTLYQPNRIVLAVPPGASGFLVLADPWFPGWKCRVDGQETPIYRANFLFRAVEVPAGAREVVFTLEPTWFRWGWLLSAATFLAVLAATMLAWFTGRPCNSASYL
jgi:hypothetical protein